MPFRTVPAASLATLFCLAVVRQRWPREIPTLGAAAAELGVSRELAPRLRGRFYEPVVELFSRMNRPGPKGPDSQLASVHNRVQVLEALLGVARAIIAAAGIAAFASRRREQLVTAVEGLHREHGISYEAIARAIGFAARTLRRLRGRRQANESLGPRSRAPKRPHGKLPQPLAGLITTFVSLFPELSLAELHRRFVTHHAQRCVKHGHPKLAYTTFVRYSGRSPQQDDSGVPKPRRGRDSPDNLPYRALALMDTTDIDCFGFGFKLIPFMEAHSREIFAHQLCDHDRAQHVADVLERGQEDSGGVLALRIDRGTPYLAELTTEKANGLGVAMRVAKAYTPTDKALIERFFLTAKDALRTVLSCVDLRDGPGDPLWRKDLARAIASAVIAQYLRWGYPYIPQPHIDGLAPRQRTQQAEHVAADTDDTVRQVLDDRVRHHEHAKTLARQLHNVYGFRWSITTWLKSVRGFTAEDLQQASDRFDKLLLKRCFHCDSRRNPRYLLAILRTVAAERHQRERAQRRRQHAERHAQQQCAADASHIQDLQDEADRRRTDPDAAAHKALELAQIAVDNHGFGLNIAERWMSEALNACGDQGQHQLDMTVAGLLTDARSDEVRGWLAALLEHRPTARPTPLCVDLSV